LVEEGIAVDVTSIPPGKMVLDSDVASLCSEVASTKMGEYVVISSSFRARPLGVTVWAKVESENIVVAGAKLVEEIKMTGCMVVISSVNTRPLGIIVVIWTGNIVDEGIQIPGCGLVMSMSSRPAGNRVVDGMKVLVGTKVDGKWVIASSSPKIPPGKMVVDCRGVVDRGVESVNAGGNDDTMTVLVCGACVVWR
jgi:hypothetical protein